MTIPSLLPHLSQTPLVSVMISLLYLTFSPALPQIEGGDSIVVNRQYSAKLTFTNRFNTTLTGAVLKVEGYGLLKGSCEAR